MAEFLPDLPLLEIFRHLGIVDLARARAVSRRWKVLIDCCVRIEELAICSDTISKTSKWFHLNKKVDLKHVIKLDVTSSGFTKFNQSIVRLHLLNSLKRLLVVREWPELTEGRDVNKLFSRLAGKFPALEHLEIELYFDEDDVASCTLVHLNLKVFSLSFMYDYGELEIEIDCPRLEILRCPAAFDKLIITNPETIKQLYYYRFKNCESNRFADSSDLEAFANVELYVSNVVYTLKDVNIWSLPKLKELRVEDEETNVRLEKWTSDEHVNFVRFIMPQLIAKKESLSSARRSAKIYLNDIECSANLKECHPLLRDLVDASNAY